MSMPNDFLARSMPPASAKLETMWAFLEQGIDYVMSNAQGDIPYPKYMDFYTTLYNFCSSRMSPTPSASFEHSECMHACIRLRSQ